MRVVIDTNVLISAIFWSGKPKRILNMARRGDFTFITSEALLQELKRVLSEDPFRLEDEEISKIENSIREIAEIEKPQTKVQECRDEADNRVLECAIEGRADYIVTGDEDLLGLTSFRGVRIAKVADFLRISGKE